jgi:aminopeptidase YwaD
MLQHLSVDIGIRAGGTPGEQQAADYLRDTLSSWGWEASEQQFPIQVYVPVTTELSETSPEQHQFSPLVLLGSKTGVIEGELINVPNLGNPGDFPANTAGRIALIERGTLSFTEKVQNAEAAGAIGVIIYNNQSGNVQGPLRVPSNIPAITISQEEGQPLVADVNAMPVRVRIDVQADVSSGESHNVIGKAPGSDCRLLVGGHYDSVPAGPGANDNGSGTVVAMEIARVLATRGEMQHVCITLFGSEERGLVGSAYYASQMSDAERAGTIGVLNFDMLGVGNEWPFIGTDSLTQLAEQIASQNGISSRIDPSLPIGVGSDHASFAQYGIPVILFNCFCDPNYHLATDRFEYVKPERLTEAGKIGLGMLAALRPTS